MKSIDDKKVTLQVVKDGLSELQALSTHLTAYLETVDKRTNRFFHCVTTSKITTYYLLNQLQDVLEKSVQQLHAVVERRSRQAIGEALCLFQGTLTISDGLIAEAGQTHEVQVYNLKAILSELQEKMEAGIEEIEAEIISFRNTPE